MKQFLLIIALVISVMSFGQSAGNDDIINALKKGDVATFNTYFDNAIDIKLPEKSEAKNVDKGEAGNTLKGFFDKAGIKGFDLTSQRAMGGTMYMTGKLTGGAKDYNITVMMKQKDNKTTIITVRVN
jgi:hypothetical protein